MAPEISNAYAQTNFTARQWLTVLLLLDTSFILKARPNIIHWNELAKGGHFAAFEPPTLCTQELRDCFRGIRKG